jgi:hypothetical protein
VPLACVAEISISFAFDQAEGREREKQSSAHPEKRSNRDEIKLMENVKWWKFFMNHLEKCHIEIRVLPRCILNIFNRSSQARACRLYVFFQRAKCWSERRGNSDARNFHISIIYELEMHDMNGRKASSSTPATPLDSFRTRLQRELLLLRLSVESFFI